MDQTGSMTKWLDFILSKSGALLNSAAYTDVCLFTTRYLEYEVFQEYANKICFITPDVTQFIKLYEGEI